MMVATSASRLGMVSTMRVLFAGLLISLAACKKPEQPGCTMANCRTMVDACRVEAVHGIPSECFQYAQEEGAVDFRERADAYCVEQCNGTESGEFISCIASKADVCRTDSAFADACPVSKNPPEASCNETCGEKKDSCDDACSGGRACTACRSAGNSDCSDVCPATGRIACIDCSEKCLDTYITCRDACPRAK